MNADMESPTSKTQLSIIQGVGHTSTTSSSSFSGRSVIHHSRPNCLAPFSPVIRQLVILSVRTSLCSLPRPLCQYDRRSATNLAGKGGGSWSVLTGNSLAHGTSGLSASKRCSPMTLRGKKDDSRYGLLIATREGLCSRSLPPCQESIGRSCFSTAALLPPAPICPLNSSSMALIAALSHPAPLPR